MLSRVLRREQAGSTVPIVWTPVGDGQPPGHGQPPGAGAASRPVADAEIATLSKRVAELERLVEQRAAQARAQGKEEGRAAGRKEATAELQPVIDRLARCIQDIAGLGPVLRAKAERDLVRLALAIAKRVLNRELAADPEAVLALVQAGLQKLKQGESCRVRVHPEHKRPLEIALNEAGGGLQPEVVGDPSLERGAVILETERGDLDASVATQLAEIERGLADRLIRQGK